MKYNYLQAFSISSVRCVTVQFKYIYIYIEGWKASRQLRWQVHHKSQVMKGALQIVFWGLARQVAEQRFFAEAQTTGCRGLERL